MDNACSVRIYNHTTLLYFMLQFNKWRCISIVQILLFQFRLSMNKHLNLLEANIYTCSEIICDTLNTTAEWIRIIHSVTLFVYWHMQQGKVVRILNTTIGHLQDIYRIEHRIVNWLLKTMYYLRNRTHHWGPHGNLMPGGPKLCELFLTAHLTLQN